MKCIKSTDASERDGSYSGIHMLSPYLPKMRIKGGETTQLGVVLTQEMRARSGLLQWVCGRRVTYNL
jgi:hypothetical protein